MGRGMQDSSGVLVKGHMGNAALLGRGIENEVARAGLEGGGRKSSLVSRIPRQKPPRYPVSYLNQPGAVYAGGAFAAPEIRRLVEEGIGAANRNAAGLVRPGDKVPGRYTIPSMGRVPDTIGRHYRPHWHPTMQALLPIQRCPPHPHDRPSLHRPKGLHQTPHRHPPHIAI